MCVGGYSKVALCALAWMRRRSAWYLEKEERSALGTEGGGGELTLDVGLDDLLLLLLL